MNLREEIEIFLKETYQSGNCMPREHIAATRLLHIFEKRIDAMIENIVSTDGMDVPHVFHVDGYRNALLDVKEMLK